MQSWDVMIVGGGPAGSSAAWHLRRGGASVLVIDKEPFPRLKLCAGWITPEVVQDLAIDPHTYPHRFLTFDRLHAHVKGLHLRLNCVQHSIRRFEFDAWLLERSGAERVTHTVRNIRREAGGYVIDERFVRMWRLYLAGSIAAFTTGTLQLFQVVFAPYDNNDIPLTRAYMYQG